MVLYAIEYSTPHAQLGCIFSLNNEAYHFRYKTSIFNASGNLRTPQIGPSV